EHEREIQRFRRPPRGGAEGGRNESHVRALLRIGYPQSQHHGVRADHRKGEDSRRDAAFWDNDGRLAGTGRMAPAERNPTRGDGIDRGVLETSVEYFGACRVRVVIGERARSEGCTWTKNRPKGQPMDCRFAQAWVVEEQLCAAASDPGFAGSDTGA